MTATLQHEQYAIGFGCSTRATSEDVLCLIRAAVDPIPSETTIATLDRRAPIGGVVAATLGLRLMLFPAAALATIEAVTIRSSRAFAETQTSSVAEAAALAALGTAGRLVVTQIKGHLCTCAVAALDREVRP